MDQARPPQGEPSTGQTEGERRQGTGRNLPLAVGVGVGLGALTLVSLFTIKVIFLVVMAVFLALALHELVRAFKTRDIVVPLLPVATGLFAGVAFAYYKGPMGLTACASITLLVVLIWRMTANPDGYVRDVTASAFSVFYFVIMGGIVALMLAPDDGDYRIVIFISVTVSSDIGGFFAGSFLGKHKMAPSISPKKTWEGFAGSTLTCVGIGAWLVPWLLDGGEIWQGALLGLAVVCSATLGDLIESMIKRDLDIKDMGSLLPGHGGVMDRLDSLIATAPIVWLALESFASTG